MEYDPQDFRFLIQPILANRADVVYGSRFSGPEGYFLPLWHLAANRLITTLFSARHGRKVTDVETCYKVFRRELIQEIAPLLQETRFGVELEMTARLLRKRGVRFYERPIRYDRRSWAEGKKIGWRDGLRSLVVHLEVLTAQYHRRDTPRNKRSVHEHAQRGIPPHHWQYRIDRAPYRMINPPGRVLGRA